MYNIMLSEFKPESELIVQKHDILRPKYPVVDFHTHLRRMSKADVRIVNAELKKYGVVGLVNLTGLAEGDDLDSMLELSRDSRLITFSSVDVRRLDDPDFPDYVSRVVGEAYKNGARGLKFFKSLSLGVKDSQGRYIPADSPKLKPIWETAGQLGIPILIHIADPIAFFKPIDSRNERIDELNQHPDWSFTKEGMFTFEQLMVQQDNLIKSNPETTFVVAHVGSASENLGFVADQLEKHPNMYVDIAARISELGRQPYSARKFLIRYQDRVLFGTDIDGWTLYGRAHEIYPYYYRFLETDDEYFDYSPCPVQGRWRIYGVHLPDDVLEKIYYKNAVKLVPEFAKYIERI